MKDMCVSILTSNLNSSMDIGTKKAIYKGVVVESLRKGASPIQIYISFRLELFQL